jgi:hypothetical protein
MKMSVVSVWNPSRSTLFYQRLETYMIQLCCIRPLTDRVTLIHTLMKATQKAMWSRVAFHTRMKYLERQRQLLLRVIPRMSNVCLSRRKIKRF